MGHFELPLFMSVMFYSLKITHLANRKLYLIIIGPNSHENLTKSVIMSSWKQCEHCSKSFVKPPGSHIILIIISDPNSHEN